MLMAQVRKVPPKIFNTPKADRSATLLPRHKDGGQRVNSPKRGALHCVALTPRSLSELSGVVR